MDEAQNLGKFLTNLTYEAQLLSRDFEIIACLDGSKDDSFALVSQFAKFQPIKILPLKNQRGLGAAFKRLFLETIKDSQDDDLIISLDADNTHSSEQLSEMLEHFQRNNLDLLIASRFCNSSIVRNFPLQRRFISKATSHFLQKLFSVKKISGEKLQDFTSGYRIYKAQKLKELFALQKDQFINETEFTYTCELLIKLSRINCRIDEIPVYYNYGEKLGKSKLRITRNFFRLIVLLKNLSQR